jgi:hypothetical protein
MSIIRDGFQSADLDVPVVLPTLNLDFANSQKLDPRITFTRGSIGTFVNKNGLIETAAANTPRFDYDPISGECKGLLIEEQRTNLVTNSTSPTFTNLTGLSTTTDGSLAPDGSNAIVYIPTTTATYHASNNNFCSINLDTVGIATGSTYDVTYSMWIKDYNNSDLGVYFVSQSTISGTSPAYALRIAKPKSASWIGGGSLGTGWTRNYEKVIPYQNGWYRFIQSYRYTRQTSYNTLDFYIQIYNNRNAQFYRGDGVSGIHIWGPQVETAVSPSQGAFETSYIPTSGSTVTRSPDLARLQEPYFSQFFNKYEGSVFVNYNINNPVDSGSVYGLQRSQTLFYIGNRSDGTYQGYGVIQTMGSDYNHRLTGQPASQRTNFGSGNIYTSGSPITNGRVCFSYDADKLKGTNDKLKYVLSGNRKGTNNYTQSVTTQVFNEITIGWGQVGGASNRYITGTIKKLQFYPKSLNDAQMLYLVS